MRPVPSIDIKINLANAAFEDNPEEINRIFATAAFAMARMRRAQRSDTISLFDVNGNRVGHVSYNTGE